MNLKALQQSFIDFIYEDQDVLTNQIIAQDPKQRLNIYRNNVLSCLLNSLQLTYPVIARHMGEGDFPLVARHYTHKYRPVSGNLDDYGDGFAEFLALIKPNSYFADLASLEWACHKALLAADHLKSDMQLLSQIAPKQYQDLKFTLHPSACLIKSKWPLQNLITETDDPGKRKVYYFLIFRHDFEVVIEPLLPDVYVFVTKLAAHKRLLDAYEVAIKKNPDFILTNCLEKYILNGVLCL